MIVTIVSCIGLQKWKHLSEETKFRLPTGKHHSVPFPPDKSLLSSCHVLWNPNCLMKPNCLMFQKIRLHQECPTCASALVSIVLNSMLLFECVLWPPFFHAWLIGKSEIRCSLYRFIRSRHLWNVRYPGVIDRPHSWIVSPAQIIYEKRHGYLIAKVKVCC